MTNIVTTTAEEGLGQRYRSIQNFILVWLAPDIDDTSAIYIDLTKQLRRIANPVEKFTDPDECIDFITDIRQLKSFLIISYSYACRIMPYIHDIRQLEAIYIFSQDMSYHEESMTHWPKVIGIFRHVTSICESLKIFIRRRDEDKLTVSMASIEDIDSNKHLHELNQSFMYTQLLKEIILDLNYDERSVKDLTHYLREEYGDNEYQLKFITEFEGNYFKGTPIEWYTRETFLYRMLNYALRIQDVDCIIKMGFFIRDLHNQIKQLHAEQYPVGKTRLFTVYRGQGMSCADFKKLQNSIGGLISFNNFLSTSEDYHFSFAFAESHQDHSDLTGILFEITIDTTKTRVPFADLHNTSYMKDEYEILFSMHTIFRICKIEQLSENNKLWKVLLELTADNDELLEKLTKHMRDEIQNDDSKWHQLTALLVLVGQFDTAEQFYKMLLDRAEIESEKAHTYNKFGLLKTTICQYTEALSFYDEALDIYRRLVPLNHKNFGSIYNNIAMTYNGMGEYDKAFSFHEKSIEIFEKQLPADDPSLADAYNNIAMVYENKGEYSKALCFFEKSFNIRQMILPSNHPSLANSYNNIAMAYYKMERYSEAISFIERTLLIEQNTMPPNHPSLAISYGNIAVIYERTKQYSKAIFFLEKSIEILEKSYGPTHQDCYDSYTFMADIYKQMKEYSRALSFYEKSLQIQQKLVPSNHANLVFLYNGIAHIYMELHEYLNARLFFEKSIQILEEKPSQNYLVAASLYNNIACTYILVEQYSAALPFLEKSLSIHQRRLCPDHPDLATLYYHIGSCHRLTNQHSKALLFYDKSRLIREKILFPSHPHLATLYTDISLVYTQIQEYSMAYWFFRRAFNIHQCLLSSDHPDLKIYRNFLEFVKQKCK
ncbi:unnamed protein product [Adineta ricciae]|uniref:Uncharacterized protein n=1 Tax=Adineta ricciae TaxID=249248 RepID=A0A815XI63_ADIRI|nr:unnamed protein product [Adineta ricciae]